jgi:MFS family permease
MLNTGLWLAPGGLAMMLTAPIAARIAGRRGPRFTLAVGCAIICASYVSGLWLIGSAPLMLVFNVLVSIGVGFAFASMPSLINAAVPVSETAAANGINSLARALGTSISSAVMAAILAGLTMSFAGGELPTLAAFRIALLVAAGAALVAVVFALLIPSPETPVSEWPVPPMSSLERSTYLVCDRIDAAGPLSLGDIAREFHIDVPTAGRHVTELLREGLALGTETEDSLSFRLTPRGRDLLYRHRAAVGV